MSKSKKALNILVIVLFLLFALFNSTFFIPQNAYASPDTWVQTTQADFDAGVKTNVVTTNVSGGEVKLDVESSAYTTPVAKSAIATREYSSAFSAAKTIDDSTSTMWVATASASTTDWMKFAIANDTYTTPVSADASKTYNDNPGSYGAQRAMDGNTETQWYGQAANNWIRFVIANDTWTTPTTAYESSSHSSFPIGNIKDNNTGTKWIALTSGATDDFVILGTTSDVFTTPTSATASTHHAAGPPAKAIDESISTNWYGSTSGSTTDWIKFDMGSVKNISGVRIYKEEGSSNEIANIKVSTNNVNWITKETGTTLKDDKWSYFWWGISGIRYIKVEITNPGGTHPNLAEFDALVYSGATVSTDGCRIMQGDQTYNTQTVKIEATNDDQTWTTLYSGTGLIGEQWKYFNWASRNARFIRISITNPAGSYPTIQEFDYRKTSDNVGNVSVKGIRIWTGESQTISIAYSTTDDEDASYTNLKTGVVCAGTPGWNYYAWNTQDVKYIRVSVTNLGGESYPMIYEFDYRTADKKVGTNGCRIYGAYGTDTVNISVSTTDYEDSAFSNVLTGQTVIANQWNEFSWSAQDTKYIKVAITGTTQYPAMAEFDAKKVSYYSSGTLASQVHDSGVAGASWDQLSWSEALQANTDITFEVRASDTSFTKDAATPSWTSVGGTSPVTSSLPSGRYQQWRATLSTSDTASTPTLYDATITYISAANTAPVITLGTIAQETDGSKWVRIDYTGTDAENDTCSLVTYQYSQDNTNWFTMTEKAGVGSNGTTGLAFTAAGASLMFAWDVNADLPNTADSTVYIRLKPNDGTIDGDMQTFSTFAIDTKDPANIGCSDPANNATGVSVDPTLTSLTAIDDSPPIKYYFLLDSVSNFSNSEGKQQSSGWQTATTWQPSTLDPLDDYWWKVKAKDSYGNESNYGTAWKFTTEEHTLSFTISSGSTNFGSLTHSSIYQATPDITLTVTTNAQNGYEIKVKDEGNQIDSPGLYNQVEDYLIASNEATLVAGTEGYGIQASSSTATIASAYDKSGNNVGGLLRTLTLLASNSGPVTSETTIIVHKTAVSTLTPSGSYTDTITYTCTANY